MLLGSFILLNGWQLDVELLYSQVKPNILIIFDTSGSMNAVIYFPYDPDDTDGYAGTGYHPGTNYRTGRDFRGGFDELSSTRWIARWISGSTAYTNTHSTGVYGKSSEDRIQVGSTGEDNLEVGDWIINRGGTAYAQISQKNDNWIDLTNRVGTFGLSNSNSNNELIFNTNDYEFRVVKLYGCVHSNKQCCLPKGRVACTSDFR